MEDHVKCFAEEMLEFAEWFFVDCATTHYTYIAWSGQQGIQPLNYADFVKSLVRSEPRVRTGSSYRDCSRTTRQPVFRGCHFKRPEVRGGAWTLPAVADSGLTVEDSDIPW